MEGAGTNQNTASTSAPSWAHVVRGHFPSQAGLDSNSVNSNSSCEDQVGAEGITQNNDIKRLHSPSISISPLPSLEKLVLGSDSEVWPAPGEDPERPTTPTPSPSPSPSASASTSSSTIGPIPSSAKQDKRNAPIRPLFPRRSETNAPNRPFFPRASETNGYMPRGKNLPNRPFFSQVSQTIGYLPPGRNPPNRPAFSHNTNIAHSMDQVPRGHGYRPKGVNGNMHNNHDQRERPPRGGYGNMHNHMHQQREYNYNRGSQPIHGFNNYAMYHQFGPMNNMRQPPLSQLPLVDGVTNQFYMNVVPMSTYYFPQPMYFDDPSGGPYFMPTLHPVPSISQINADLRKKIVKQVDFYFSSDNLSTDRYLRGKMDDCGWVAISVVAGFKMMTKLTNDVNLILDALVDSTVVEVQGDKIRRQNDWFKWPNPEFILGAQKQGQMDASSSSETASELGTSERVFPERDTPWGFA